LAARIDVATVELEAGGSAAGRANGGDLGVRGGVERGRDEVGPLGENGAIAHYEGAERTAPARAHVLDRELDGALHEVVLHSWILLRIVTGPTTTRAPAGARRLPGTPPATSADLRR